jgi:hypothetical protein
MIELLMLVVGIGIGYAAREIVSRRQRMAERNRRRAAAPIPEDSPIELKRAEDRKPRIRLMGT